MGKYKYAIILILWGSSLFSQTGGLGSSAASSGVVNGGPYAPQPKEEPMGYLVFKPVIGLGCGMFSFYGDLKPKSFFQNPSTGRLAYDLTVSQKLNDFLQFNFYTLFGKLGVTEDITTRNANFESQIRSGGVTLQYNFNHFLPKKRDVEPFIALGIESFEFLSKTDMYDKNGNKYYYWTDGSIKNMDQHSVNAANAINLVRDYKYETDIRQANLDGFGKYTESSFAIPVSIGAIFHLSERVDLKLHTTMHFTFTDYIDGITDKSVANRQGNGRNDMFMMTGFSLHWDLLGPKQPVDTLGEEWFKDVDFPAMEMADSDGDGVRDTADICPGTPPSVIVSAKGCPNDGDDDGVPDYADKELDSKPKAYVDADGVTLSDSIIKAHYLRFIDTSNTYAEVISYFHRPNEKKQPAIVVRHHEPNITADGKFIPAEYTIILGTYRSGLPPETMSKFLSIRDIETNPLPDSSIAYTVGHYQNFAEAQKRKDLAIKDGINDAKIVYKKDGLFIEATSDIIGELSTKEIKDDKGHGHKTDNINKTEKGVKTEKSSKENKGNESPTEPLSKEDSAKVANAKGVVFRIQLGAYKRRLSKSVFGNMNDLIEIRTEDGLYKYMTGSYSTFSDAAGAKLELSIKGYTGSFITAYKDGKRIPLTSVGATPSSKKGIKENIDETEKPINAVDKKLVVFKVQIGVYKGEPPADKQAKYDAIKEGVQKERTSTGLNAYVVGNYNDYNEALRLKNKMKDEGIEDAFIIAFFNGQYIPLQEALELSK